jgi:copper(I)-binding protein
MRSILFALSLFSASAFAQIQVEKPWVRATAIKRGRVDE